MNSKLPALFSSRLLPAFAAVAAAGFLGASGVHAGHGAGADPYVFTDWGGDQLWSNAGNWNQPEPAGPGHVAWINFGAPAAIINYSAPSIGEFMIGQGGGNGAVQMTTGGSISGSHMNLAHDGGRDGTYTQDGGSLILSGELRAGENATGGIATVNISNGTFQSGNAFIGHLNSATNMTISGGTVTLNDTRVSDKSSTTTATGTLTVTGGTLNALQIGIGARTGGTGTGHLIVGGTGTVNTTNHIFLRPDGRGNMTVNGSTATININRSGSTGFEVTAGSVVNFNADAGGFSTVNIPASTMRFSSDQGIINIDTNGIGNGLYPLFTFGGGYFATANDNIWGTENITGLNPGQSAGISYDANTIGLQVIPEPGTYAAIFGALALAGVLIRRRFRK